MPLCHLPSILGFWHRGGECEGDHEEEAKAKGFLRNGKFKKSLELEPELLPSWFIFLEEIEVKKTYLGKETKTS